MLNKELNYIGPNKLIAFRAQYPYYSQLWYNNMLQVIKKYVIISRTEGSKDKERA